MRRPDKSSDATCYYIRASRELDRLVEEVRRVELRTKAAVLVLALTEYAERHHPALYERYKGVAS